MASRLATYEGMAREYRFLANLYENHPDSFRNQIKRLVERWGGRWNENTGGGCEQGIVSGDGWHIGVTDESIALWDQPEDQPYQDFPAMEECAG